MGVFTAGMTAEDSVTGRGRCWMRERVQYCCHTRRIGSDKDRWLGGAVWRWADRGELVRLGSWWRVLVAGHGGGGQTPRVYYQFWGEEVGLGD